MPVRADFEGGLGHRDHHAEPGHALTAPPRAEDSRDQETRTRSDQARAVMTEQRRHTIRSVMQAVQFQAATYTPSAACYPRDWERWVVTRCSQEVELLSRDHNFYDASNDNSVEENIETQERTQRTKIV